MPSILYCVFWFYFLAVTWFFWSSVVSACFKIQIIQHLYISMLDRLFSYASSAVTVNENLKRIRSVDSFENLDTYDDDLIERDIQLTEGGVKVKMHLVPDQRGFRLHYPIYLVKCGIEAIIEDSVTKRFTAAELRVWNFLSRNQSYVYAKKDNHTTLMMLWLVGLIVRYVIFLPCRLVVFFSSVFFTWIIGAVARKLPPSRFKNWLSTEGIQAAVRLNLCSFSAVIRFHNRENRPKANTICVANHTTPFDWCVLASDVTYAVVGQKHGGFFGFAERIISCAVPAIWFDRDEILDRHSTAKRLKNHAATPNAEPILIFPEGTCINNTSVMKFKKGCFEVGAEIHPVAIRYNPLFADCFWNSSLDSLFQYSLKIMTSWAIMVDVWYLPPTRKSDQEDSIAFARRVQYSIAQCGGMIGMDWDGELKRNRAKDTLKYAQQKYVSQYVIPADSQSSST
uniref:PlsC domain-containing protein n=1 Tax=Schistosoma mansoni TaxID=6183 RepID=A0A5K4EZZ5_SCHMA